MSQQKRNNYLRTYRRRCALSQKELAFLLGSHDGMVPSRYERGERQPSIRTICAFAVALRAPGRQLFAGVFDSVERDVRRRARQLIRTVEHQQRSRSTQRKLEVLREIAEDVTDDAR